jgi:hypothetical protein
MRRRNGIKKGHLGKVKRRKFGLKWFLSSLMSSLSYRKNNLKKILDEFSEQLRRTMGCHVVLLVSHKKRTDQSLNVIP